MILVLKGKFTGNSLFFKWQEVVALDPLSRFPRGIAVLPHEDLACVTAHLEEEAGICIEAFVRSTNVETSQIIQRYSNLYSMLRTESLVRATSHSESRPPQQSFGVTCPYD